MLVARSYPARSFILDQHLRTDSGKKSCLQTWKGLSQKHSCLSELHLLRRCLNLTGHRVTQICLIKRSWTLSRNRGTSASAGRTLLEEKPCLQTWKTLSWKHFCSKDLHYCKVTSVPLKTKKKENTFYSCSNKERNFTKVVFPTNSTRNSLLSWKTKTLFLFWAKSSHIFLLEKWHQRSKYKAFSAAHPTDRIAHPIKFYVQNIWQQAIKVDTSSSQYSQVSMETVSA